MRHERIRQAITAQFLDLQHFDITDESHKHAGRAGTESHFKLMLVSDSFKGLSRVQRQRKLYQLLDPEFQSGLHALSLRLLTAAEFSEQKESFKTPDCAGEG